MEGATSHLCSLSVCGVWAPARPSAPLGVDRHGTHRGPTGSDACPPAVSLLCLALHRSPAPCTPTARVWGVQASRAPCPPNTLQAPHMCFWNTPPPWPCCPMSPAPGQWLFLNWANLSRWASRGRWHSWHCKPPVPCSPRRAVGPAMAGSPPAWDSEGSGDRQTSPAFCSSPLSGHSGRLLDTCDFPGAVRGACCLWQNVG